jgi:hypothetical protein
MHGILLACLLCFVVQRIINALLLCTPAWRAFSTKKGGYLSFDFGEEIIASRTC